MSDCHLSNAWDQNILLRLSYGIDDKIEGLFSEGSIVYAKANPDLTSNVRRYIESIYYCTMPAQPAPKELADVGRELTVDAAVAGK